MGFVVCKEDDNQRHMLIINHMYSGPTFFLFIIKVLKDTNIFGL